jgi:hypothetical protein
MRVIAFIEKPNVIKKILKHLSLWHVKIKPQPLAHAPPINTISLMWYFGVAKNARIGLQTTCHVPNISGSTKSW